MENMKLTYLLMMLIFVIRVLSTRCPAERNTNILKSIAFNLTDSSDFKLHDMQYDSETDEYFYLGHIYSNNPFYPHFISRMDNVGNRIWGRAYDMNYRFQLSVHNTLQYSSSNQALYFLVYPNPYVVVKVDSSNGNIVQTYQIDGATQINWYWSQCRLSNGGQAYYCNVPNSLSSRYIVRFDTADERIDVAEISNAHYQRGYSILDISDSEVLYSYREYSSSIHHIVKANYNQSIGLIYSLSEQNHQTINADSRYGSASSLGESSDTIWHAIGLQFSVIYFQYNLANFSLIGSKYASPNAGREFRSLKMEVGEGIVCILTAYTGKFLAIVNATTREPIQVYDDITPFYTNDLMLKNGYIGIIGCSNLNGPYCYHKQIQISTGLENLASLEISTSNSFSVTNDYNHTNKVLINYSMSSDTDPLPYTLRTDSYTVQRVSSESYILSLPDSLNHSLNVRHEETSSIDLPCKLDNFTSTLSCEIGDDSPPSWATVNCANSQIEIEQSSENNDTTDSFSIKSTFPNDELISNFNLTLVVSCDDFNCISCTNGACEACSSNYTLNSTTFLCEENSETCPDGYRLNSNNSTCELISDACSPGFQWNNETSSCEGISRTCPTGYEYNNTISSCVPIPDSCSSGYEWSNTTSSCVLIKHTNDCSYGPIYISTKQTKMAQAVGWIGICVGIISALLLGISVQSVWTIINFLQLILILPLIAKAMDEKVNEFIVSNTYATLSIYILPCNIIKSIPLFKELSFDQPDEYLKNIGWSSGSTLVNNLILLVTIFALFIAHLTLCLLYRLTKNKTSKFSSGVLKVYQFFTFSIYIRIAIQVYMLTALMIISEIKYYFKNGGDDNFGHQKEGGDEQSRGNYISILISFVLLTVLLLFVILTFISWRKIKNNLKIGENCKMRELYQGIFDAIPKKLIYQNANNEESQSLSNVPNTPVKIKLARLYTLLFLIRRSIIILIVVLIPSSDSFFITKICSLLVLQALCIIYAIFIRSFSSIKDHVVEACNEFVLLILLILLLKFKSRNDWSITVNNVFIGLILLQLWVLLFVPAISATIKLVRLLRRIKMKNDTYNPEEVQSENIGTRGNNDEKRPSSVDEQISQNRLVIHKGSKSLAASRNDHQSVFEEDKKANIELYNSYFM